VYPENEKGGCRAALIDSARCLAERVGHLLNFIRQRRDWMFAIFGGNVTRGTPHDVIPTFFVDLAPAPGLERVSVRVKTFPGVGDPNLAEPYHDRVARVFAALAIRVNRHLGEHRRVEREALDISGHFVPDRGMQREAASAVFGL
jgi:hypothetical protein